MAHASGAHWGTRHQTACSYIRARASFSNHASKATNRRAPSACRSHRFHRAGQSWTDCRLTDHFVSASPAMTVLDRSLEATRPLAEPQNLMAAIMAATPVQASTRQLAVATGFFERFEAALQRAEEVLDSAMQHDFSLGAPQFACSNTTQTMWRGGGRIQEESAVFNKKQARKDVERCKSAPCGRVLERDLLPSRTRESCCLVLEQVAASAGPTAKKRQAEQSL